METLIHKLRQLGVGIGVRGDQLKLDIPDGVDIQPYLEEIRANKAPLLDFIKKIRGEQDPQTILPAAESSSYPLSSSQQRLYFLHQLHPQSLVYNMPLVVRLDGNVDITRLENAFRQLIARHESLRTVFLVQDEMPVQQILPDLPFTLQQERIKEEAIGPVIREFIRPFDLAAGPLIRAGLIMREGEEKITEALLMIDIHHIITDGLSGNIMVRDLTAFYNGAALQPMQLQYKDYTVWMQQPPQLEAAARHSHFWTGVFAEAYQLPELPADHKRPPLKNNHSALIEFALPAIHLERLQTLAKEEGATMFMMFLALYKVLLSRLCNEEDMVVGVPVTGRLHPELENVMGLFVNTLPLRTAPQGRLPFREYLRQVKNITIDSFEHQAFPYETLVESLKITRALNRNPLFDVFFIYQHIAPSDETMPGTGMQLQPLNTGHQLSQFDLTLAVKDTGTDIRFIFEYVTELFEPATILRFRDYFLNMAACIAAEDQVLLQDIPLLSADDRQQLIQAGSGPVTAFPAGQTVMSLFAAQAIAHPDKPALLLENTTITYGVLYEWALRIAGYLQQQCGIGKGGLVGVMLQREEMLLPVIYGVMMAGAVYVPLDPAYPEERVQTMVQHAGIRVMVTRGGEWQEKLPACTVADLDQCLAAVTAATPLLKDMSEAGKLAYVIHTSGSTGVPKGVMITHEAVVNRLWWMQNAYPIGTTDVLIQKTPVVFDVSVWELFWWSIAGASLHLLPPGAEKDPQAITNAVEKYQVSTIHFVPAMLGSFLSVLEAGAGFGRLKSLRQVFCSGEALKPAHAETFRDTLYTYNNSRLINLYGPTEATVDVTYYECRFNNGWVPETGVPIGRPIDNVRLYVLDRYLQPALPGTAGELCIAGIALAQGYLGQEQLTAEKFVHAAATGERIYRTGDLARWSRDGQLEYLGRIDAQVKIRGYRIEPEEIEQALLRITNVKEAAVLVHTTQNEDKRLAAFIVTEGEGAGTFAIRKQLKKSLPDYMVPAVITLLDHLPLTINGKIDRKNLLLRIQPQERDVAGLKMPVTPVEKQVAAIWEELLGVRNVSLLDTFFDLGGHSLLLIKNNQRIEKIFGVVLPFAAYFNQTLEQIAMEISNRIPENAAAGN